MSIAPDRLPEAFGGSIVMATGFGGATDGRHPP